MAKLPFMKVFVPDLISDTYMLTDGEFGAYCRIIFALWRFKGVLPLDHAKLRKIAGATGKSWPGRWAAISRYFVIEGGVLSHARVTEDLREAGAEVAQGLPGESSKGNGKAFYGLPGESSLSDKPLENNNPASPRAHSRELQPQLEPELDADTPSEHQQPRAGEDWPDGGVEAWEAKLAAVSGGRLDPNKEPNLTITRGILAQWHVAGLSFSLDVLPVVQGLCRRQKRAVSSWMFFNAAVREAHARRLASATPAATFSGDRHDDKLARKNANWRRSLDGARAALERERDG